METVFFTPQAQYFNERPETSAAEQAVPSGAARPVSAQEIETSRHLFEQFSLTPLTAGDIIDRAIRLYRQHFLVFLRIVLAPSLIAYAGGILWALGARNFSLERGDQRLLTTVSLMAAGGLLWLSGKALFLMLLGGASRGLVWYFFNGTPLSARAAFQAVRERWRSLLGATLLVSFLLLVVLIGAYIVVSFALVIYFLLAAWLLSGLPTWVQLIAHGLFGIIVTAGGVLLLLFTYARVVYVPQALMVEGKGIGESITRSLRMANREIRRIFVLVLFQICVILSLYWLLMIPLGWYAYWNGLELSFFSVNTPLWFNVAEQTLSQIGQILIAPIILLGFTLLYLDTRVRNEGFDIELLANRVLPPARATEQTLSAPSQGITWEPEPSINVLRAPLGLARHTPAFTQPRVAAAPPRPRAANPSASPPRPATEAAVTIPLTQPQEFSEVVPLSATHNEPAVQTIELGAAPPNPLPTAATAAEPGNSPPALTPADVVFPVQRRFCGSCGAPATETASAVCPDCGADL
jgi:hypothetical protein